MRDLTINTILEQNPWWMDPSVVAGRPGPRRDIFATLKTRVIERELITAIVGLRRVGKTTLVKQVIDFLIESGVDRRRILYFSCENVESKRAADILQHVITYQVKKHPDAKIYFFFDEIQYVDGWNVVLKKNFDMHPKLKFVVTGSASLFIATHARESLAGRIQEIVIYPMSYGEYLRVNKKITLPKVDIAEDVRPLESMGQMLEEHFQPYLAWGEFPYLENLPTWAEKKEYILEFVLKKVLEVDLPRLKNFYGTELSRLMDVLVVNSGQLIEMQNLGTDIGLSQNTLREYLATLEKTYLISQVFNRGIGYRTRSVRQRKIYASSVNAVVLKSGVTFEPGIWQVKAGSFVENYVFNYLKRQEAGEVDFWRERQIREVDFIWWRQGTKVPVEVKYQPKIRPEDLKNLVYYCGKEKLHKAVVITRNKSGMEKLKDIHIHFIPACYLV